MAVFYTNLCRIPINIYRQAFILLMTAFDAVMFEIAEKIFVNNFFKCIDKLKPTEKISYKDISKYTSFEDFKSETVKDAIGSIYIHKLLFILREFRGDSFIVNGTDIFIDIIEMIKRRNTHVHNRGIVDQQYFESGINHNIFDLKLGDYAIINDSYYINANEKIKDLIKNLEV